MVLALLSACGTRPVKPVVDDDELNSFGGGPALQMYLILTADTQAMQQADSVEKMWKAVAGEGTRYAPIRKRVKWVPNGYKADVTLDFANLPHKMFSARQLAPMIADLPADLQAKAKAASLAVLVRSDAKQLPDGNHIRLGGLAALYAADAHNGVIIDLLARRAWTPAAWHAELMKAALTTTAQTRISMRKQKQGDGIWLLTRGHVKYGVPDLHMRDVPLEKRNAALSLMAKVQVELLKKDGRVGQTRAGSILKKCRTDKGLDGECVEIVLH